MSIACRPLKLEVRNGANDDAQYDVVVDKCNCVLKSLNLLEYREM